MIWPKMSVLRLAKPALCMQKKPHMQRPCGEKAHVVGETKAKEKEERHLMELVNVPRARLCQGCRPVFKHRRIQRRGREGHDQISVLKRLLWLLMGKKSEGGKEDMSKPVKRPLHVAKVGRKVAWCGQVAVKLEGCGLT